MQALARMGANVTGIEPQHDNISAAIAHAQADPVVAERTTYLAVTAEELASSGWFHEHVACDGHAGSVKACSCCDSNLTLVGSSCMCNASSQQELIPLVACELLHHESAHAEPCCLLILPAGTAKLLDICIVR